MTFYRACVGCTLQGQPCGARETMRARIKGLSVTSVKWRCTSRESRFVVGELVWAHTVDGGQVSGEEGEPIFADFPAVVIKMLAGAKALVFIDPGVECSDGETQFSTSGIGFCKIPLSRLKTRDGTRVEVCPACDLPSFKGHLEGYSCHPAMPQRVKVTP